MLRPQSIQAYVSTSKILGEYGNPWDSRVGANWYPVEEPGNSNERRDDFTQAIAGGGLEPAVHGRREWPRHRFESRDVFLATNCFCRQGSGDRCTTDVPWPPHNTVSGSIYGVGGRLLSFRINDLDVGGPDFPQMEPGGGLAQGGGALFSGGIGSIPNSRLFLSSISSIRKLTFADGGGRYNLLPRTKSSRGRVSWRHAHPGRTPTPSA